MYHNMTIILMPTHDTDIRYGNHFTFIHNISYNTIQFIEDITRWREDMNFMFEWQEQYLTSERSE